MIVFYDCRKKLADFISSSKCTFIHDFLQFTAPLALGLGLLANHGAELLYRGCFAPYTARAITLLLDHLV